MSAVKAGWCKKQGGVVKNWKRRYFVLTPSEVTYYEKEPPSKALGVIAITNVTKVSVDPDPKHTFGFLIQSSKRTYYISAETAAERDSWVSSISQVINAKLSTSPESVPSQTSSNSDKKTVNPFASMPRIKFDDFEVISVIGEGSFGKMRLVKLKGSPTLYALKSMRLRDLIEKQILGYVQNECQALTKIKSDYITKAYVTFTDDKHIYIVMDFLPGGELFKRIETEGHFEIDRIRLYSAQIALGISDLHQQKIIHRDLKPENILFDADGYLHIADFGYAKATHGPTGTILGTSLYMAPEILFGAPYSFEVDWWALGIIVFEMATGYPPFYDDNGDLMSKSIVEAKPPIPDDLDPDLADLIYRLLEKEPKRRLANFQSFKNHKFFQEYTEEKWKQIINRELTMPWKPNINMDTVLNNFDDCYTSQEANGTFAEAYNLNVDGFSMMRNDL